MQAEGDGGGQQPVTDAQAETAAPAEPSPDRRQLLSHEVLSALDAEIHIEAKDVRSGKDELGSALLQMGLKDVRLAVEPLQLSTPGGVARLDMDFTTTPDDVTFNLKALIEEFDIGIMARRMKPDTDMGSKLTLDVELHSQAKDLASVMQNADGHFNFALVPQNFSAGSSQKMNRLMVSRPVRQPGASQWQKTRQKTRCTPPAQSQRKWSNELALWLMLTGCSGPVVALRHQTAYQP